MIGRLSSKYASLVTGEGIQGFGHRGVDNRRVAAFLRTRLSKASTYSLPAAELKPECRR